MNRRVIALCALFALSGFCGLIYESIWSHYLKHFVGHAAYAQSLVLMVFMGGMGLGAWLVSRWTERIGNLLWAYAAVEAVVGLSALVFHPLYGRVVEWAYASLLPSWCAAEGPCAAQWGLATLLILPQSVLLGTTFPLMTGGVIRLVSGRPGYTLALLYFLNSVGAVVGVLASGFVLIPLVGLPGTLMTAGLGNVLLALAVYYIGKTAGALPPPAGPAASVPQPAMGRRMTVTLLAVSLLTGLSSFVYEMVWIRMLSMVLGSATHSFEIMLASFILGLALGGWWIRTRIDAVRSALPVLAGVQVAMGLMALTTLPLYNHTFDAMAWLLSGVTRTEQGYLLFNLAQVAIALVVMLPTTFCAGMTLPLITVHLFRHGSGERAIGQVYAANTVGAIAGVLLAIHVLLPLAGLKLALVTGAAIDIGLGLWLLLHRADVPGRLVPALRVAALAATGVVIGAPWGADFDPMRMASSVFRHGRAVMTDGQLLFARDGKTATVQVVGTSGGAVSLLTNGKSDGAIQMKPGAPTAADETTMVLLGALPLIYRPHAAEVAQIGFGTGMSAATLLASPHLKRLDTIEIERTMVEAARLFRPVNDAAYTDPRHHVVIEDAKAYFAKGARRYDVIVSEPSNPWVSGVSSLFSAEFYERMRTHLKSDGILVQWMHVYEITPTLVASVFAALERSFPAYEVYLGANSDLIIVAGGAQAHLVQADAWKQMPGLRAMLGRVGIDGDDRLAIQYLTGHRVLGPLLSSYRGGVNSDYFPLVDLNGPKSRFMQSSAHDMTLLHSAEVPLLRAIDGRARVSFVGEPPTPQDMLSRQLPYVRARQLVAFVREGTVPPDGRGYLGDIDKAWTLRWRLFTCGPDPQPPAAWDDIVRLATETVPFLSVAEASDFWRSVRNSPCASRRTPHERRWLDLLTTVAEGAWERAGPEAVALLADPKTAGTLQRTVLAQVAATTRLRSGDRAGAMAVLDAERAAITTAAASEGWLRLLRAHAGSPAR